MEVLRTTGAPAQIAAAVIARRLDLALQERRRASLAVSGGSTPWRAFEALAATGLDWSRIDLYQVDERVVPPGDPARNLAGIVSTLAGRVPVALRPMPVDAPDLDYAASRYGLALPERLDVIQLGLGDDGHTASLVPDDPVLEVRNRPVAVTGPYRGHRRMTLTFPVLEDAATLVWLVAGADKATVVARLLDGDASIPAGRVPQARAVLVTDSI